MGVSSGLAVFWKRFTAASTMLLAKAKSISSGQRKIARRIFLAAAFIAACPLLVHFGRLYGPRLWSNVHVVNFVVNLIPTMFSILFAFVIDKDLEHKMRKIWRLSIILGGGLWSFLLWHQQALTDQQNAAQMSSAVTQAVNAANLHSDRSFGNLNTRVDGLGKELDQIATTLSTSFKNATNELDVNIGKVGRVNPPPEPAQLMFSFYDDNYRNTSQPSETAFSSVNPNGSYTFSFVVRNISSVQAEAAEVWIHLCQICTFAAEPVRSDKPTGMDENSRHIAIGDLNAGVSFQKTDISFRVASRVPSVGVAFTWACKNCGSLKTTKDFTVVLDIRPPL